MKATAIRIAFSVAFCAAALSTVAAAPAAGHPLGNFTINHISYVTVSSDRVDVLYVLDQAEIPTFREQQANFTNAQLLRRKRIYAQATLALTVDGRRMPLQPLSGAKLTFPPGQAGLDTLRAELPFRARVSNPRLVQLHDSSYDDSLGYVDMVARPGRGTAVTTKVPRSDPTGGLRTYRGSTLRSAPERRIGEFRAKPGRGTLLAPGVGSVAKADDAGGGGFASVFEHAADGDGLFLLLLLAAFGWGALHALSPGHGKAMVAAYLVGTRGTARHALALGGIVTVTHTIGVFALGLVTLLLSQFILPEDLFPWLNLTAGLLIVVVGAGVLRSRIEWAGRRRARQSDDPRQDAEHELEPADGHAHHHGDHHHHHGDHHHPPDTTWKGLAAMGISAGIIPCPTALVVLLAAITQNEIALGLLLIVVFSLGLAATLTGLGLAVVYAKRLAARASRRASLPSWATALIPVASTFLILGVGLALTAKAIPSVV
jgi:nickel/cobalt transporter (NicO) family protein